MATSDYFRLRISKSPDIGGERVVASHLCDLGRAQHVAYRIDRGVKAHDLRYLEGLVLPGELVVIAKIPRRIRKLVEVGLVFRAGSPAAVLDRQL